MSQKKLEKGKQHVRQEHTRPLDWDYLRAVFHPEYLNQPWGDYRHDPLITGSKNLESAFKCNKEHN